MDTTRRLWLGLATLLIASFSVLLWMGRDMHQQSPPLPERVVTESGHVVYTRADMERGRQVWQSIGGQQLGSIWGHGALLLAWFVARHWILPVRAVTPQARAA